VSELAEAVLAAKDAYRQMQWAGLPAGDDATCIACGSRFSEGCEPGCFAGDGWNALVEFCNASFQSNSYRAALVERNARLDRIERLSRGEGA
jgi:hypothetical protein